MPNLFEGSLVRLRAPESHDAETIFQHHHDSEISRRDNRIGWPRSVDEVRQQITTTRDDQSSDNRDLIIEMCDGQLVGGIDIQSANSRNGTFSIGIGLSDRSAWGKGYAKEAMLLALRYMFHERRYQKCTISVYSFNTRAIGLYHRLGFQDEGRMRRMYFTNGTYYDELFLGMTREEFDEQYPAWHVTLEEDQAQSNDPTRTEN